MDIKFSIVCPAFNAEKTIGRAIRSILNQTYPKFELIVINDGSTDETQRRVSELMKIDRRIRMFVTTENYGKLAARNLGNKMAQYEWLCMLDADDEYMSNYLEVLVDEIERNPDYGIFNFGTLFKNREVIDGQRYEKGYTLLPPLPIDSIDIFPSGRITSGGFIFKKELLGGNSFYPETKIAYGDSNESYPALLAQKYSIFKEICKQNEEGHWLPLGNPFGDDCTLFWYLTRCDKSKCLDVILNIHHVRV